MAISQFHLVETIRVMSTRPPLVMVHGAFCGPWAFDKFRVPFEAYGYVVHAPCLRFHDAGSQPAHMLGTTSIVDYTNDLEKIAEGLGEVPILVGHSLGGLLVQMLAARRTPRALVLLAPSAPWGVLPSTAFEITSAQAMLLAGDYWNSLLQPNYGIAALHSLDKLSPAERNSTFSRFVPESGLATFEVMHWTLDQKRAARVSPRDVACPILCLAGAGDRINPPSTVRRIAGRYRGNVRFEVLDNHSHWLIGEPGWEDVASRAIEWLDVVLAPENARDSRPS